MQALKDADPADQAEMNRRIGLTLTNHPQEKRAAAVAVVGVAAVAVVVSYEHAYDLVRAHGEAAIPS